MDSLYDADGHRLYLTKTEREAFLKAAAKVPRDVRSFCEVLHFAGRRISEALALTPKHIDFENKALVSKPFKNAVRAYPGQFLFLFSDRKPVILDGLGDTEEPSIKLKKPIAADAHPA